MERVDSLDVICELEDLGSDLDSFDAGKVGCINSVSPSSSSDPISPSYFVGPSNGEFFMETSHGALLREEPPAPVQSRKRPQSFEEEESKLDDCNLDRKTQYLMANELRRKRVNVFLRILKRDIRRDIPVMFANAWNSSNSCTIESFFQQFCAADCRSVDYAQLSFLSNRLPIKISQGVSQVVNRFSGFFPYVPDFVFQIIESNIHVQLGVPGSKLVIKSIMYGTRLQDCVVDVVDQNNRIHTMPSWIYSALCSTGAAVVTQAVVHKSFPYKVDIRSTITLTLDEENRVHRVVLDHNSIVARCG